MDEEMKSPEVGLFEACLILRSTVEERKELELEMATVAYDVLKQIEELEAELESLQAPFQDRIDLIREDEDLLRECIVELYQEIQTDRNARMRAGEEVGQPELPQGVSFGVTPALEYTGTVPFEYMRPDDKLVKSILKRRDEELDFAVLVPKYHVRVGG